MVTERDVFHSFLQSWNLIILLLRFYNLFCFHFHHLIFHGTLDFMIVMDHSFLKTLLVSPFLYNVYAYSSGQVTFTVVFRAIYRTCVSYLVLISNYMITIRSRIGMHLRSEGLYLLIYIYIFCYYLFIYCTPVGQYQNLK